MLLLCFEPRPDATYFKVFFFCDSYERCFCVCVCACHLCHAERFHPTHPGSKRTRAAQAAVQHNHRTLHRLIYMGAPVYPFATCNTPGISSLPHPEEEPCMYLYQIHLLFAHWRPFPFRPRIFLALSAPGHAGEAVSYTHLTLPTNREV